MSPSKVPVLLGICLTIVANSRAAVLPAEESLEKRVDEAVRAVIPKDGPGTAVMIVHQGDPILQKGYGLAVIEEGRPITKDTRFRLASVSKQFTAACVALLVHQGRLALDDTLRDVFPDFPEYADRITIRHLLHHTSGLRNYMRLVEEEDFGSYMPTSMDIVDLLSSQDGLDFAPGEKLAYSNSGYVTLAMIVQEVAGEPFADFAKRELFDPLGMKDTVYRDERQLPIEGGVKSYRKSAQEWADADHHPLNRVVGDGAVFSNLVDIVQWDRAWRNGKFLGEDLMKEALTTGKTNDGKEVGYGFGWRLVDLIGRPTACHSGGWLGFRTFIGRWVEDELTVVVLCNWAEANPKALALSLAQIYFDRSESGN